MSYLFLYRIAAEQSGNEFPYCCAIKSYKEALKSDIYKFIENDARY